LGVGKPAVPAIIPDVLVVAGDAWSVGPEAGLDPPPPQPAQAVFVDEGRAAPDGEADALATTPPCFSGDVPQLTRIRPTTITPKTGVTSWILIPLIASVISLLPTSSRLPLGKSQSRPGRSLRLGP